MPKEHEKGDDVTLAILEELRASRETNAALMGVIAKMTEGINKPPPADPWAERAKELRDQILNRPHRNDEIKLGCVSQFTGATYDAKVTDGIVVDLMNYKYPKSHLTRVADGGQVPNELIRSIPEDISSLERTSENMPYLRWLWESTYQIDLRSIVNKPFGAARVEPRGTAVYLGNGPSVDMS